MQDENDIILRVTSTAICGNDLHMYSGGIPQPRPMVMGHEFMGIVEEVGKNIKHLIVGDRVVVLFQLHVEDVTFANMIFVAVVNIQILKIIDLKEV